MKRKSQSVKEARQSLEVAIRELPKAKLNAVQGAGGGEIIISP